ncbi:putative mitochondrial protein [Andalucia godoyi]|uniref:Putative mitochondrial protein n=1 Tax=Andalucia godoyi TaxID=505711 RepID=A0A8K0AH93_ANDGO|nr:putative mitochondrial protein [Andalucia godoyi]|eukprot:ANDGO_06457.mRNA.1 putative mitochondrial protein
MFRAALLVFGSRHGLIHNSLLLRPLSSYPPPPPPPPPRPPRPSSSSSSSSSSPPQHPRYPFFVDSLRNWWNRLRLNFSMMRVGWNMIRTSSRIGKEFHQQSRSDLNRQPFDAPPAGMNSLLSSIVALMQQIIRSATASGSGTGTGTGLSVSIVLDRLNGSAKGRKLFGTGIQLHPFQSVYSEQVEIGSSNIVNRIISIRVMGSLGAGMVDARFENDRLRRMLVRDDHGRQEIIDNDRDNDGGDIDGDDDHRGGSGTFSGSRNAGRRIVIDVDAK